MDFDWMRSADFSQAAADRLPRFPALVITSLGLSDLDGLALCRRLRQTNPRHNPLILVISDRTSPAELQSVLDAGADDYILYPIDSERLRIRLRIAVQRAKHRTVAADVENRL